MPTYLHPGVYMEEIPSGSKPIEGVATSVAAFVGQASRGPVDEAVLIQGFEDYVKTYGPIASETDHMGFAVSAFYQNGGTSAYIARLAGSGATASFADVAGQNTGGANVIKVSASSVGAWGDTVYFMIKKPNTTDLSFTLEVGHLDDNNEFEAEEVFSGLDMNERSDNYLLKRVNGVSALVSLSLEAAADPDDGTNQYEKGTLVSGDTTGTDFNADTKDNMVMTLNIDGQGAKRIDLGLKSDVADGDATVTAAELAAAVQTAVVALGPTNTPYKDFTCAFAANQFTLTSGSDASYSSVQVYDGDGADTDLAKLMKLDTAGAPTATHGSAKVIPQAVAGPFNEGQQLLTGSDTAPAPADYQSFFNTKLVKVRDVSIIVLPGQSMPKNSTGNQAIDHAISHCEATKSRMVIIDPEEGFELDTAGKVDQMTLTTSTYGVLYYPWVQVANPFYDADKTPNKNPTLYTAPSGFAAGMWSKIDGRRGVWKAPAGVETAILGASGLQYDVGDGDQDQLNPNGVNCLRTMPGYGRVIWGARTRSTKSNPEWRYVPVRRTAIFIEQSIYNGIQWAVFEPNNHVLWSNLRVNIETFMNGLFRAGAFQGQKASDAYFVRCGKGDTMTQGDIDRGQVIVIVGFAPLKPAEFVIVRIQQKVAQE
ncbi:MAG: phage tail sheath subtilisin-like domain-containing protein [Acidobacteriota bacterium]|nr:phage tail sheath subtilisin-like domain-containing protein [Acidobacteriota bacterium]